MLKELYHSVMQSMLGKYAVYVVNLISLMILSRQFSPTDFGIIASVTVFYLFFQLMAEAGIGPAIINQDKLTVDERNGIYSLTILVGLILGILFFSISPLLEQFYQTQNIISVVPHVAFSIFFFTASVVPIAALLKQQSFYNLAFANLLSEIISTICVLALKHYIESIDALASRISISSVTTFIMVWILSKNTDIGRPTLGKNLSAIYPLLSFSGYQFAFNFVNYFSRNLDNLLVGRYMGVSALGFYEKSYQLMRYPLMLLTFAMTPAIQPVIRKYASDVIAVERIHQEFTFKLSIIGVIVAVCFLLLSETIVLVVLGPQWMQVVPIIEILALTIPVQVVLSTSGSFFQAMGRADLLFKSGLISAVFMISAIVVGILFNSIELLCWLLLIAFHINFIQAYYYLYFKVFLVSSLGFITKMIPLWLSGFVLVAIKIQFLNES
ncbi:lipopolysaccharide biosynthesis protein [Limnobacter sp.]|uniref:lipopolysaccharide biosynthesis protein n=1 Tax=Limnobacter sp. TaxID=2003368 RepID=UPI0027BA5E9A|nr:lipopolysaccharide biosynthesis protein [Limnobacter sp.]